MTLEWLEKSMKQTQLVYKVKIRKTKEQRHETVYIKLTSRNRSYKKKPRFKETYIYIKEKLVRDCVILQKVHSLVWKKKTRRYWIQK